jgi:hypothetical protein
MYEWGNATLPASNPTGPLFDGQLYVDDQQQIWQWDATGGAWRHRDDFHRVESMAQECATNGNSVTTGPFRYVHSRNSNQWDDIFNRSFVKLEWRDPSPPYALVTTQRVAHMDTAELTTWMQANGPQAAGRFTANCLLTAYEVVSPQMRITRMMAMHRMYGSMRGRKAYMGAFGRKLGDTANGEYKNAGYGTRFKNYFGAANLCRDLIQDIWGQTPNPADPNDGRALWFPVAKKSGKYRIGDGSEVYLDGPGLNGRMCWDTNTQTYVTAPAGAYQPAGTDVRWLSVQEPSGTTIQIDRMTSSVTKGSGFARDRLGIVVAVPIQSAGDNALKSVLLYPMGITHVTLKIDQDLGLASDIFVVNEYDVTSQTPIKLRVPGASVENPAANMFRMPMSQIAVMLGVKGVVRKTGLDDPGIPSRLSFYLRDPVTGLRSALGDRQIMKVMRKNNVPLAWAESPLE